MVSEESKKARIKVSEALDACDNFEYPDFGDHEGMGEAYNKAVEVAVEAAMVAFNYAASSLGLSGFQAGASAWQILSKITGIKRFRTVNLDKLLYPQYENDWDSPSFWEEIESNIDWLALEAKKLLDESSEKTHPEVKRHWRKLVSMGIILVPMSSDAFKVKDE